MGNLRQKYTDEEWHELEDKIKQKKMTREEIEKKNNQFRKERIAEQRETMLELAERLNKGRDYLMQVEPNKLTVTDALEAFGFGRNG